MSMRRRLLACAGIALLVMFTSSCSEGGIGMGVPVSGGGARWSGPSGFAPAGEPVRWTDRAPTAASALRSVLPLVLRRIASDPRLGIAEHYLFRQRIWQVSQFGAWTRHSHRH